MKFDVYQVKQFLFNFQDMICQQLIVVDGVEFVEDSWQCEVGGGGCSWVLRNGGVFEQVGVNFLYVYGEVMFVFVIVYCLEFVGCSFEVMGVLLVVYSYNLYVFISYVNVWFFIVEKLGVDFVWWFGGGFDLILFYGFEEDVIYWYCIVCDLCLLFGEDVYFCYKKWCDEYFYFKYCNEQCGIGGLFFDDLNTLDFDRCFVFMQVVGKGYIDVYLLIVE